MTFSVVPNETNKPVIIGESNRSANNIGIKVASDEPDKKVEVKVTVSVNYGSSATDLLDSKDSSLTATYQSGTGTPVSPMSSVTRSKSGQREWDTGSFATSLPLSIQLSKFVSNTPPGEVNIDILVQSSLGINKWSDGDTFPIKVTKIDEVTDEPKMHHLVVNPDYILDAGQTEVSLSFYATGYQNIALFRNNKEVKTWLETGDKGNIAGFFVDKPSITSVYRLEAYRSDTSKAENYSRTVQVISPGWNQIALPQGSPVRLFVAKDYSGSGLDRLYGIFKGSDGLFKLYSSATGVDDWREEIGEVPQDMAMSPGVNYKEKLWLIGGSSVNSSKPSTQVWCYEKVAEESNERNWRLQSINNYFPVRMGHACIVFPRKTKDKNGKDITVEELWVIGGYNNGIAYQDVWRLIDDDSGGGELKWEELVGVAPKWQKRLNPAAVSVTNVEYQNEVWIYGGSIDTQSQGLTDLWVTDDGITWKETTVTETEGAIVPDPGTPLGSTLLAYPQLDSSGENAGYDRLFLIGSFKEWAGGKREGLQGNRISSLLFEWHGATKIWEAQPVLNGWQQFQGNNYYMQAIAFNGFLFVWSLQPTISSNLKLNILVSQ